MENLLYVMLLEKTPTYKLMSLQAGNRENNYLL